MGDGVCNSIQYEGWLRMSLAQDNKRGLEEGDSE